MQLKLKWLMLLSGMLFALNHLPVSWARYIIPTNETESTWAVPYTFTTTSTLAEIIETTSTNNTSQNNTVGIGELVDAGGSGSTNNTSQNNTVGIAEGVDAGGSGDDVAHIKRRRQASCPPEPDDLNVLHAPCDMDTPELGKYIETLPNQCICAYNARHNSEIDYRKFKILQLEAFFFGQYSERFKRFETDAPI